MSDPIDEVKEEIKEEDEEHGVMEERSKGHENLYKDLKMEPPSNMNPPERCSSPRYCHQDPTQEGHPIPHHHQSGVMSDPIDDVKEDIKEEDEEHGVMEELSEGHKDLYKDTMVASRYRKPPERCPRPLSSWDSKQSGIMSDPRDDVKEEIKEEDEEHGVMEERSEGHKDLYEDTMESPSYRKPPERCPRPLSSWDPTQKGHTYMGHHECEDLIKVEVTEEPYVRDDQQYTKEKVEAGMRRTFIEEDTPTHISTANQHLAADVSSEDAGVPQVEEEMEEVASASSGDGAERDGGEALRQGTHLELAGDHSVDEDPMGLIREQDLRPMRNPARVDSAIRMLRMGDYLTLLRWHRQLVVDYRERDGEGPAPEEPEWLQHL